MKPSPAYARGVLDLGGEIRAPSPKLGCVGDRSTRLRTSTGRSRCWIKRPTVLALAAAAFMLLSWPYLVHAQALCNNLPPPNAGDCTTGYECVNGIWVCGQNYDPYAAPAALQNPLAPTGGSVDPNELFARVAAGFIFLIGGVTLFFVVWGGYGILTAAGNSERYAQGKKTIAWAIVGLIVVVGSYVLLSTALNVATGGQGLAPFEQYMLTDPLGLIKLKGTGGAVFYGGRLAKFFVSGLSAVTVLMVVYGGLQWVLAAGNEEKITKAKQTLAYAFVGAVAVMSAYIIINFIYTPIYNLFNSPTGQVPQTNLTVQADLASTTKVACFRREVGKNYAGTCDLETPSECLKATSELQRGEYLLAFTDCNQVGACVQNLPGLGFKDRLAASKCSEGNPTGLKVFGAISYANIDGSCPFKQTVAMYTGNNYERKCWAEVSFSPGVDWPTTDQWACVREKLNPDGTPTRNYDCAEETAYACGRATANHTTGTFYTQRACDVIGYCEQNWAGHYACRDGKVDQLCTPQLFPPVGSPVPPWGCGAYQEINGQCYVPESGISFHTSGSSGTHCPYSH